MTEELNEVLGKKLFKGFLFLIFTENESQYQL
jgi:hypothetical protein